MDLGELACMLHSTSYSSAAPACVFVCLGIDRPLHLRAISGERMDKKNLTSLLHVLQYTRYVCTQQAEDGEVNSTAAIYSHLKKRVQYSCIW